MFKANYDFVDCFVFYTGCKNTAPESEGIRTTKPIQAIGEKKTSGRAVLEIVFARAPRGRTTGSFWHCLQPN